LEKKLPEEQRKNNEEKAMLVISNAREVRELEKILNESFTLHLFVNDIPLDGEAVIGDLVECSSPGYAEIPLSYESWSIALANGRAEATYPVETFTMPSLEADLSVYGYYVTDVNGFAWGERLTDPLTFSAGNNAEVNITASRFHRTAVTA